MNLKNIYKYALLDENLDIDGLQLRKNLQFLY